MKSLASITIPIKGRDWTFKLISDKQFDKAHNKEDEGNTGMTIPTQYEVHFSKSHWTIVDIRHEVGHVLKHMCNTHTADLDPGQVEELMCQIIGTYTPEIILISDRVAEKFLTYDKD